MTQGFYEQLGVDPESSTKEIRGAYARVVANLSRRRKALLEQGGDAAALDLSRSQVDEAWQVLSDPARRRRYDAFRALQQEGWTTEPDLLWKRVSGALVHPAAATAAELLRVSTDLMVGVLPPAPGIGEGPRLDPEPDNELTVTDNAIGRRRRPEGAADVVPLPTAQAEAPAPSLRVVEGSPSAPSVIVLSQGGEGRDRAVSAEEIARLADRHGYSGALLAAVREARGLSLQEVADSTRISVRYLEAIEQDQFDRLPSATFVRGYVREMARLLKLEEEAVVAGYMRRFSSG